MKKPTKQKELSHLDSSGKAKMVDISKKGVSIREARAQAVVSIKSSVLEQAISYNNKKGNIFATARIAGIMAAKNCWQLIPLCHQISLAKVEIKFFLDKQNSKIVTTSNCKTILAQTGVEMEALMAVSIASLTIYDMCKALDKNIIISDTYLTYKTGGKSFEITNPCYQIKNTIEL